MAGLKLSTPLELNTGLLSISLHAVILVFFHGNFSTVRGRGRLHHMISFYFFYFFVFFLLEIFSRKKRTDTDHFDI